MDINNNRQPIEESVLSAIKAGEIQMRPKWRYVLTAVLAVVGGLIILGLVVYLISLIIFMEQQSGATVAPAFGLRGWGRFLVSLPWLLILFSILFILVLELLVRRYSFAYRRPLMYSAFSIIALVMVGGFIVAGTSFHERIRPPFYRTFIERGPGDIHRGFFQMHEPQGFILIDRFGRAFNVVVASDTQPFDRTGFAPGEAVVVFGDPQSTSTIRAFGIRRMMMK